MKRRRGIVARRMMAPFVAVATLAFVPSCQRRNEQPIATPPAETAPPVETPKRAGEADLISAAIGGIRGNDPETSSARLASLRGELDAAGDAAAARAIMGFLRRGEDAPTGLGFRVGPDGGLSRAPTVRVALIDWLPGYDPDAALDVARATIAAAESPDECALALRNIAWNDHDGDLRDELRVAFERVMNRPGWRGDPSQGFLESLDIGVELGDAPAFALVSQLLAEAARDDNAALLRATFIALDRMTIRDPLLLAAAADALPPLQRAALMSRLDPTVETQREILTAYLTNARDAAETAEFAALFPNGNRFHGNWLVTSPEPAPSIRERWERDREILHAIEDMLPGLPAAAKEPLEAARQRIASMTSGPPPD